MGEPIYLDDDADGGAVSWDDVRDKIDALSDERGEWQGIPVPLMGMRCRVHDRHPMREALELFERTTDDSEFVCSERDVDEDAWLIVNQWYDAKHNRDVTIVRRDGRTRALVSRRSPDGSMDRLTFWLSTIGATDAWDLDAEHKAREKLRGMLTERQWRHYDLTGSFLETSKRSRLTYMFRRLRPTIAMTPRWRWRDHESMRCLAVLCLHPIGYYDQTWGGCMVPTDDVIAHLLLMRGDEAHFWRKANQHDPARPEAGI